MRRINAILTAVILVLFLVHAVLGGLLLVGAGHDAFTMIARTCEGLIYIHLLIGLKLTFDTIWTSYKAGTHYFWENRLFWARRISGLLIMILMILHSRAFSVTVDGVYRLKVFDSAKLITQILFVLSLALHIISNVRPALISFGIRKLRPYEGDILFILSVVLLFFVIAFVIYFLRWQII